ncbi:hypothetical protein KHA93_00175 [Bacillus sp. FJAT-49732]|uniref:Uncharacterized protein n=1 Tax=Lederbergia citrisecunda TaxID=2833583 RepID=A0A942THF4_9BACI|nr:hypothetical protein [Lederbergia citrisecunda]MBS4198075.1 hypothetical protein [Lederbergia citrisecunda]
MNHMTYENWLEYVRDELNEETRKVYENHLYSCDHCLELYLKAVEATEFQMPGLEEVSSFTDSIMQQVTELNKPKTKPKPRKKISQKQTIVHYFVAAAVTLVLMSTGVFSHLMNMASSFEHSEQKQAESFVQSFLNKQDSFTNKFEEILKEEDRHE